MKQPFRERLAHTGCVGMFSKTLDSSFVEAAGLSGLDFMIFDREHGPVSHERLLDHVRAARLTGMTSIVRVSALDHHSLGAALDSGADGIQVPNITCAEEARRAVDGARFHPLGTRGVCRFVRAAGYGTRERSDYFAEANRALLILQVEGVEGIENLDEILEVEGYDVLFVGPYDLSQSVGKPGQVEAPEVRAMMAEVARKAQARGVALGAFADTPERLASLREEGFSYLAYSVDIGLFADSCRQLVETL